MKLRILRPYSEELKAIHLFAAIDEAALAGLETACRSQTYQPGQVIFQAGDTCRSVAVVLSGTVGLYFHSESGQEVIIQELRAGDIMGEIEVVLGMPRTTSAVASEVTRLLEIDRHAFSRLLRQPEISEFILRSCARKLLSALGFAEGVALYPIETRLARLLIDLAEVHGKPYGTGILIDKVVSQNRMGQLINASRPRVNAQLQMWKARRIIDLERNRILIHDPEHLRRRSRRISTAKSSR
ncbi:Crp/Fnr family transcriptional regulator [Rhizobium sp. RU36D]|uniref:Crp/Fnr family transcriptional regulator n=1 Tax=Rhizobium sp. RU36D TaxID=1907415 RepID=UPI0009D8587B|nr:Crp/Fnr family transcriptional regulator [Rhizobium sp. RU36D]SMD06843.1 cAMP-binding domain of CRP or a regulatory subunit of cAMP-dependent protein kinases [Rhizobium sp. RU36D]